MIRNKSVHIFQLADVMDFPVELRLLADEQEKATHVLTHGRGPGSLEHDSTAGLDYHVITGDRIQEGIPWLWALYTDERLYKAVSELIGRPLRPSASIQSAVNVNIVAGNGGRYEWHVDGEPYSLILFASDVLAGQGGALQLRTGGGLVAVQPAVGLCVLFDGAAIPHAVSPLTQPGVTRISVPMVFSKPDTAERPAGLNEYLYTPVSEGQKEVAHDAA